MAGSDFTFSRIVLDLRKYLPLGAGPGPGHPGLCPVRPAGEVPFYGSPSSGANTLLRGIYKGRFRDKAVSWRSRPSTGPSSSTASVSSASPAWPTSSPGWAGIPGGRLKFSVGTGLRYVVNKRDGTTLRLDLAWGRACFGLYVTAKEAF